MYFNNQNYYFLSMALRYRYYYWIECAQEQSCPLAYLTGTIVLILQRGIIKATKPLYHDYNIFKWNL